LLERYFREPTTALPRKREILDARFGWTPDTLDCPKGEQGERYKEEDAGEKW
jgi:hypothetical protein